MGTNKYYRPFTVLTKGLNFKHMTGKRTSDATSEVFLCISGSPVSGS
jgi:hypothetical protein